MAPLFSRLLVPPKGSFFLFGPRGTGKSTWLRLALPQAYVVNLLDESRYQAYLADVSLFAGELATLRRGSTVIVDEIQRLPPLLNEVHRHIEERGLRFALCGSSARKLRASGTNLLAGRAVRRAMHPLVPEELGPAFDLDVVLRFGSLPVIWSAPDRKDALLAYAQTYLRDEIQAEALVRNLPGFARFLPVAALFHGQVISVAGLARDAQVARGTAQGYISVLEDTLVAYLLPAFEARLRVQERKHPKLYWVDTGLPRAIKQQLGPPSAEERGHLFEGWLATVLRAYRDYREAFDDWAYWAPGKQASIEVDFLLRRGQKFVAIEAKSKANPSNRDLNGLRAIAELPGLVRRILVFRGERRMKSADGIEMWPVQYFLNELAADRLF